MDKNDPKYRLNQQDQALWDEHVRDMDDNLTPLDSAVDIEEDIEENFEDLLDGYEQNSTDKDVIEEIELVDEKQEIPKASKNTLNVDLQIDKRTADKIRKGKMPIECRLDLHGFNQAQAYEALKHFIIQSYKAGIRSVLVITGKGKSNATSTDWLSPSKGVLKKNVPLWLSEAPLKDKILNVTPAQPKDGGSGAFYVYIRKHK